MLTKEKLKNWRLQMAYDPYKETKRLAQTEALELLDHIDKQDRDIETLTKALRSAIREAEELKDAGFGIGARDSWHEALARVHGDGK